MKCPNCGTENHAGVKFCKRCGTSLQNNSNQTNSVPNSQGNNNKTFIICITIFLCVVVIVGAFILLNDGSNDSNSVEVSAMMIIIQ